MEIKETKPGVFRVDSASGNTYYVSRVFIECNVCHSELKTFMCSCPDFLMGRPSRGINPFVHPCKHVMAVEKENKNGEDDKK